MPSYNDLRRAYGLAPVRSFTDITGEASDQFPADPKINDGHPMDDLEILDFTELRDADSNVIPLGSDNQLAIWKKQFEALRDGDRFFYANDPVLNTITQTYGIAYRHTLAEVIKLNTGLTTPANVFKAG